MYIDEIFCYFNFKFAFYLIKKLIINNRMYLNIKNSKILELGFNMAKS